MCLIIIFDRVFTTLMLQGLLYLALFFVLFVPEKTLKKYSFLRVWILSKFGHYTEHSYILVVLTSFTIRKHESGYSKGLVLLFGKRLFENLGKLLCVPCPSQRWARGELMRFGAVFKVCTCQSELNDDNFNDDKSITVPIQKNASIFNRQPHTYSIAENVNPKKHWVLVRIQNQCCVKTIYHLKQILITTRNSQH